MLNVLIIVFNKVSSLVPNVAGSDALDPISILPCTSNVKSKQIPSL